MSTTVKNKNFKIGAIILVAVVLLIAVLFFLFLRDRFSVSGQAIRQTQNSISEFSVLDECPLPYFTGLRRCDGDFIESDYFSCTLVGSSCSCSPTWIRTDNCGLGLVCQSGTCVETEIEIIVSTDQQVYSVGDSVYLR